jgi:hypothetical protein
MSGSDVSVVFDDATVILAAEDTGDVTDVGVICAVTSDKDTAGVKKDVIFVFINVYLYILAQ